MELSDKLQAKLSRLAKELAREQIKAELAGQRQRSKDAAAKRKADTRQKIELGGLVLKAGLGNLDKGTLLGGLIDIARRGKDPANSDLAEWKRIGDGLLS